MGLIELVRRIIPVSIEPDYKSGGERAIAKFLSEQGIPFWYEQELILPNGRYNERFLPDFTLKRKPKHIEYWGMADHDRGYVKRMKYKMAIYHRNNIDFLSLYERDIKWDRYQKKIEDFVKAKYKKRPKRRRTRKR